MPRQSFSAQALLDRAIKTLDLDIPASATTTLNSDGNERWLTISFDDRIEVPDHDTVLLLADAILMGLTEYIDSVESFKRIGDPSEAPHIWVWWEVSESVEQEVTA